MAEGLLAYEMIESMDRDGRHWGEFVLLVLLQSYVVGSTRAFPRIDPGETWTRLKRADERTDVCLRLLCVPLHPFLSPSTFPHISFLILHTDCFRRYIHKEHCPPFNYFLILLLDTEIGNYSMRIEIQMDFYLSVYSSTVFKYLFERRFI